MASVERLGNNRVNIIASKSELPKILELFRHQLVNPSKRAYEGVEDCEEAINKIGFDKFAVSINSDDDIPQPDPIEVLKKAGMLRLQK